MASRPGASGSTTTARLVDMAWSPSGGKNTTRSGRLLDIGPPRSFHGVMTERKPAGMSWESWRDELIRLAREEGAFDNLPGAGKPFTDLDQGYDSDWWVKKLVQREKVSVLPLALELLRKVEVELERIWKLSDEGAVRERIAVLNFEIARVNARAVEGPATRLVLLDADMIVAEWRAARTCSSRARSADRLAADPL